MVRLAAWVWDWDWDWDCVWVRVWVFLVRTATRSLGPVSPLTFGRLDISVADEQNELDKFVIGHRAADKFRDDDKPALANSSAPIDGDNDADNDSLDQKAPKRRREPPFWRRHLESILLAVALALALTLGISSQVHPLAWALGIMMLFSVAMWVDHRAQRTRKALVTQEKELERLQSLQQQYRIAEQMASLGVWSQDIKTGVLHWTRGAFRLFGVRSSQGEPSLRAFIINIHPDDQLMWRDIHRKALASGKEAKIEYRYARFGREQIWVRSVARPERNDDGEVTRLVGTVQDISGIRAMQQQLATSEGKFRELTNMSSDWVWETDDKHKVSFLSESVDAVLGTWARDSIGRHRWQTAQDVERVDWDQHRAILEAQKPFENFEYSLLDPENHLFQVSLSGRPRFDERGNFIGYRGTGRDITREKQQRLLLRLEGDMAQIMREQTEPDQVIRSIIVRVCELLGWVGGANLDRRAGTPRFSVRESSGTESFRRALSSIPADVSPIADSPEEAAWNQGKAAWIHDFSRFPQLSQRYRFGEAGVKAVFLAPIKDEGQKVISVLMFGSPTAYRASDFLGQVADSLSRTLSLYLQRKAAERRLTHASLHDALTGLPNRVYITHLLDESLKAGRSAAVLYVDLDRFKIINDTLGHSVGDQVLIEVARRFRDTIRPIDVAGRIGGDEFILLLADTADRDQIESICRQLLDAIEKPYILSNRPYFLSASIGVAIAPTDGTDGKLLIKSADAAMYTVKSEGRNDVRFFTGGLSDERSEQLQLTSELPLAIQRGEVDLYYQPIFALASRSVVGFEALLRWQHPTRGLLLPDKFLPMAEQSNLIREIGLWALRRALDDRVQLGLAKYPDVAVSVNVSARQLAEEGFLATLNALLAERGMSPRLLRLELTESALIDTSDKTIALISDLRRIGVRVIIDNFGTGYASLSYLKNLPVDGLKIDQAFIRNLPVDRGNAAIVQAITTLAGKLGFQAMAEGVETPAELKALRSYECDQMQGTLISEPLPFAQLQEFMETLPALRQMHLVKDGVQS